LQAERAGRFGESAVQDQQGVADRGALFEAFFENAVDMVCVADLDGYLRVVNPAWERVLGWTAEELCNRPYLDFVHPDDADSTLTAAAELRNGQTIQRFVNRYRRKAGGYRDLEWSSVVDLEKRIVYATVRDITDERRARRRLEEIERISGVGHWEYDLDSGQIRWSDAVRRIHEIDGDDAPELIDALAFYPPEARETLQAALARLSANGEPYDLELPFVTAKGRERWVRTNGAAERRGGRIRRVYGGIADVTETKRDALRLGQILRAANAGSWEWNVQSGETVFDALWAEQLGYTLEELSPTSFETFHRLIHPDDLDMVAKRIAAHFSGESEQYECALRMRRKDGGWKWILALGRLASRGADGAPELMFGAHIDIDERKRQEGELAAAHSRLQATLDAIPDVLLELDADGRYVGVHCGDPDLFVASHDAMFGKRLEEVLDPDVAAPVRAILHEIDETGRSTGTRLKFDVGSGERWFELSAARRPADALDARPGYIFLARDITERQRQEEALRAAREAAEAANRAKSSFLANMSHEIRTPLNGVLGMAEVLERELTEPEHKRMLGVIRQSGELLLNVINDVLDLSKIDADRMELEPAPFLPADLARNIEATYTLRAGQQALGFSVSLGPGCETPRSGDAHRIMQILHNLVGNAVKFTERGSVSVAFEAAAAGPFRVTVRDTGIGMTDEEAARVFEPFVQADVSMTRRFGGSGLGMSIVKRLVDLMGGAIDIDSAPGRGTTVQLSLPLPVVAAAPGVAEADQAEAAALAIRALAADDNEVNRIVLDAMLAHLGAQATIVNGGAEAVAARAQADYDILLLDISMPEMDGVEALARIRAVEVEAGLPRAPAVAVTANAMRHQAEAYLAAGFDAHAPKPLEPQALAAAIRGALAAAGWSA
jgi:PAS domain S-box-containing protein